MANTTQVESGTGGRGRPLAAILCLVTLLACGIAVAGTSEAKEASSEYEVVYRAALNPESGRAEVTLHLTQPRRLLRSVTFTLPGERFQNIHADPAVETSGDRVTWRPGRKGGDLHYDVVIDHRRDNGVEDARITESWALLKLDHLFPGATTRVVRNARSRSSLQLSAPADWSIETPYGQAAGRILDIEDPDRRFDQPRGWVIAGELGIRRDHIGERLVSIASPLGTGFRANDMLAFLRWTLPSMAEVFPSMPQRLLIVSGTEDMWRGGLSGRNSLYVHPDRPLISGNRTSTLLHELIHVVSELHGRDGADWIVEGLAEYYSGLLLLRSGAISERRYNESLETLARWSDGTRCVATDRSQGKRTAAAVLTLRALDEEIRARSDNAYSLDTLVLRLTEENRPVTNDGFRAAAAALVQGPVRALADCP